MPEEIRNTDGTTKQDCEINAAKRLVPKIKKDHPQLGLIIVGDDLFSRQPFITDHIYQKCREKFGSKQNMWSNIRSYIMILVYETWDIFLSFLGFLPFVCLFCTHRELLKEITIS